MAEETDNNLEKGHAQFEAEQMRAVEALRAVSPESVDFDVAEKIGLIGNKTRERIKDVYGKDMGEKLFQTTLQKGSFLKAFEAVYGKFLFEEKDSELLKSDSDLMKNLAKVLRFSLDKEGLSQRSELQAAARRLRMIMAIPKGKIAVGEKKSEIEGKRGRAQAELENYEALTASLNVLKSDIENLDESEGLNDLSAKLSQPFGSGIIDRAFEMRSLLNKIKLTVNRIGGHVEGHVQRPAEIRRVNNNLIARFDEIASDENPDYNAFKDFVNSDLKASIRRFRSLLKGEARNQPFEDQVEQLDAHHKFLTKNLPITNVAYLNKAGSERKFEENRAELFEKLKELSGNIEAFKSMGLVKLLGDIARSKNPELVTLSDEISQNCKNYADEFADEFNNLESGPSADDLKSFINDVYKPFITELENSLGRMVNANDQDSRSCRETISNFDEAIAKLKSDTAPVPPVKRILEKAFGGIEIGEDGIVKVRGFETHFKHVAEQLKAAQEYFDSPTEISALRDNHRKLSNLITKSEEQSFTTLMEDEDVGLDLTAGIKAHINKLEAKIDSENKNVIRDRVNSGPEEKTKNSLLREKQANKIAKLKEVLGVLNDNLRQTEALHKEMEKLMRNLDVARRAGAKVVVKGEEISVATIIEEFNKIDLRSSGFKPKDLTEVYKKFKEFFEGDTNVTGLADDLAKAQKEIASSTNLTDAQAAKKIISAIMAEQNPDMSPTDQQKLATMILANDVETIQTEKSYKELAKRGGAGVFEAVRELEFKEKLIGFQYNEGEKTIKPFEGLKPEQFGDWAGIERLFNIGRLNHQNGFFVLAGLEDFNGKNSIQYIRTERKLKELLARQFGVNERMDEAGINKIVNKAFTEQLEKARPLVQAYAKHHHANIPEWKENKAREININFGKLKEQRRLGKIEASVFQLRMEKLLEEARENGVVGKLDFSQNTVLADYWNRPFSQWFRDRGYDVGKYAKNKAKSFAKGIGLAGLSGTWRAGKWGVGLGINTALTPVRFFKYPLMLAGKPIIGSINLFRKNKLAPYNIRNSVRNDAGRVLGYFKDKGVAAWKESVEAAKAIPGEWEKEKYIGVKYAERTKVDTAALEEQAKELKEKGEPTPVKIVGSPFIDLDKYKKEVENLDKILKKNAGGPESAGTVGAAV